MVIFWPSGDKKTLGEGAQQGSPPVQNPVAFIVHVFKYQFGGMYM